MEKKEDIDQLIILEIPYAGSQSSVCCNSWWAGVFHTTQSTLINCRSTSYTSVRFCKSHGFHSFPQDQREGVDPPPSPRRTWLQLPQQRTIHQVACALGESQVDTQGLGPRIQWERPTGTYLKHSENGRENVLSRINFGDLDISMYIIYVP